MNRRKLGSNRRNKGRRQVKDSESEQDPELRNDVQEETRTFDPLQTQVSTATQHEMQEGLGLEKDSSLSAQYDTSLISTVSHNYSEVMHSTAEPCSEDAFKVAVGKDDKMQACKKETKLEGPEKYDAVETEETKNKMNECLPELPSLSISACSSLDQHIINKHDEESYSAAESKSKTKYDTGLFRRDKSFQANYPVSESYLTTFVSDSIAPEVTTDNSIIKVNRESKKSTEQAMVLLPKRELPTNEDGDDFLKLLEVGDSRLAADTLNIVDNTDDKPTQIQGLHPNPEDYDPQSKNLKSGINTYQLELMVKGSDDFATKQKVPTPEDLLAAVEENLENVAEINENYPKKIWISNTEKLVTSLGQYESEELGAEDDKQSVQRVKHFSEVEWKDFSVQPPLSDLNVRDNPKLQDKSLSTDEQTDANFKFGGDNKKMGSSRRKKGRCNIKESNVEVVENVEGFEPFEPSKVSLKMMRTEQQQELSPCIGHSVNQSVLHDSSRSLMNLPDRVQSSVPIKYCVTDLQSLIPTSENDQESQDEESDTKVEMVEKSVNVMRKEVDKSKTFHIVNTTCAYSEGTTKEVQEVEVYPPEMQKNVQIQHSPKSVIGAEHFQIMTDHNEISKLTMKSVDASKQEEYHKENIEALDPKGEDFNEQHNSKSHISDVEKIESTQRCVSDFKNGVEDDLESNTKQMFSHEKKVSFQSKTVSVNIQPEGSSETVDEQINFLTKLQENLQIDSSSETMTTHHFTVKEEKCHKTEKTLEEAKLKYDHYDFPDTDKQPINKSEKVNSALSQEHEFKGRVEDEIQPNTEQLFHQEKEGLSSEMEESKYAPSTLQSESDSFGSQPHEDSETVDEQSKTAFIISDRRKLDSTRGNEKKKCVKDSKGEVSINTEAEGAVGSTSMQFLTTTAMQEEKNKEANDVDVPVSHDRSMFSIIMPGHSSEVPSLLIKGGPNTDLMSTPPKTMSAPEDPDHRDTGITLRPSGKMRKAASLDIPDTLLGQEVKGFNDSILAFGQEKRLEKHQTQIRGNLRTDYSSETVETVTLEKPVIDSGDLIDHPEDINTDQSELTKRTTDSSDTKQEKSTPDDKQMKSTLDARVEVEIQSNQGVRVCDPKQILINRPEGVETALSQFEGGERSEENKQHSSGLSVHQGGVFFTEDEKKDVSDSSPLTDLNAPSDPKLHDKSLSPDEQTDADFSLSGTRRKLGSSRRNKGRRRSTESKEEVSENTKTEEALETTSVSFETKTVIQEEPKQEPKPDFNLPVPHDSSMFSIIIPGHSSEVHSLVTKHDPNVDPKGCITKAETTPNDPAQRDTGIVVELSGQLREATSLDKPDTLLIKQVRSFHDSNNAAGQEREIEKQQTQEHESLQIVYSSETVENVTLEKPVIDSGDLIDHPEDINTDQSELTKRTTDSPDTKQEKSTPDDKQIYSATIEANVEAAVQSKQGVRVCDPKQIQINRPEGVETALSQFEGGERSEENKQHSSGLSFHQGGVFFTEDEKKNVSDSSPLTDLNAPSDPKRHDKSLSPDEQTDADFSLSGTRRKLGSSRRNKGRRRSTESKEEVSENTKTEEALETLHVSLNVKTSTQEELSQGSAIVSVSQKSSLSSLTESQSSTTDNENLQDKNRSDVKTRIITDILEPTQPIGDHFDGFHKENANDNISELCKTEVKKVKVHPKQNVFGERLQSEYSERLTDHAEIPDLTVETHDYCPKTENILEESKLKRDDYDLSDTDRQPHTFLKKVDPALSQVHEFKGRVEDEIKPNTENVFHRELWSEMKNTSALSTLQSESVSFDSQPQKDSETVDEQSSTAFIISDRRKLGSSRRNKRGQRAEESKDEVSENTKADEATETSKVRLEIIAAEQKSLNKGTEPVFLPFVSQDSSVISPSGHSSEVQSSVITKHPESDPQSLIFHSESLQQDHVKRETDILVDKVEKSVNLSQQGADKSYSPHGEETRDALSSDGQRDVQKLEVRPTQMLDFLHVGRSPQTSFTENLAPGNLFEQAEMSELTVTRADDEKEEKKPASGAYSTLQSESVHFGSASPSKNGREHEQTSSMNRRKLGSSRRHKGGQNVKDSDIETYNKPIQEFEEVSTTDTESRTRDRKLHVSFLASEPVTPEKHSEKRTSGDNTNPEENVEKASPNSYTNEPPQQAEDAVKKAQEAEPEHGQGAFQIQYTAERERGDAAEQTEKIPKKSFYLTENREMTGHLSSGTDFSITSKGTEEKSNKNHNEIEHSAEQQAYSSPQDKLSTTGEEDKSTSISEAAETHHSEGIVSKKPAGQINPQIQEMHQIDFTSRIPNKPSIQTLQSDASVALGFHCQDSYQSNKHEIPSGLNRETGSRRKLGSSRRTKGRQHVEFTEANQDHEEEDDENTENYEARPMCATREEELEHFKSVEKFKTIAAEDEKTEKQLEENAFFSPNILGESTDSTSEINSNKNTKEEHNKLLREPESLSPAAEHDKDTMSLIQSAQAFVSEGDSDRQSNLKHDDIISPVLGSVSVLDQDKAILSENREVSTPRQEVQLQQTRKETETARCFTSEVHGREAVSSIDVQDPRLDEEGENLADQEVSTSPEFTAASGEPAMDKNGIFTTMDANKSHQEKTLSDSSESLQEISKLKKRKIGSSRRTQINRKQEGETPDSDKNKEFDFNTEDETKTLEKIEVVEELSSTKAVVQSEDVRLADDALVQQEPDEAKATEHDGHQQVQDANEGISSQTLEIKSTSPGLSSASRRRKMGSTRKGLGSQAKRENLHQEEELEVKAAESETITGDATRESVLEIKEGPQLHSKYQDSDQRSVEISHFGEFLFKSLAEETPEESPVSQSQVVDAEQTPHFPPSTSPKIDSLSEPATGGKKKKFGSNRKSHSQQKSKNQDEREEGATERLNEADVRGIIEGAPKAADQQREESPDLEEISEVHVKGEKASSSISISETRELSKPVSEKTWSKSNLEGIRLSVERDRQFPLGNLRGTGTSNSYNVVMIGDSCVGKTSFMKRAQSGKFSLDTPASVGLDSCLWTVVVDGKPVVLQIWDTAGQERFHSITRQVFHRAEVFLLMYDITCTQSFSAVGYWANCIQESAAENMCVLLLGNKSDDEQRLVKTEEGDSLAKEYNFAFMECSAATGENVIEALETVARMLSQRANTREETTELHKQPAQKKQSKCC